MKRLTQIFQALLGVVALILTALVAAGRLAWRTICNWWKNRSKWVRRAIASILIIISLCYVVFIAYYNYNREHGRMYWEDEYISKNIEIHAFRDHKVRVYNHCTDKYTTPKVDWVTATPEKDSLVVYALTGKRGFINAQNGKIVIDAEKNNYHKAWIFSEGLAAVMKDGKVGFINTENEVVIPFQYDYSDECRMWDWGYLYHNGYCIMTNKNGDLGLIDKNGNWVVEPSYDEIWAPHKSGYRVIVKDGMFGILDANATVIYPAQYGYITIIPEGFVLAQGGRQWQVDFDGNIVHPFMYENTYYLTYPTGYNDNGELQYAFADYVKYEVINSYGIMNRITGEPITPAIYSDINMISKELFEVQPNSTYEWYLLDTKGNVVSKK